MSRLAAPRRVRWPILAAALSVIAIDGVQGQAPPEYVVTGTVLTTDGEPVAQADVRVEGKGRVVMRIVQSDSTGRFNAARLNEPPMLVRVRAFGYLPAEVMVRPSPATHRATVTVRLELSATRLAGVGVNATSPDSDSKLAAYRDRKATNSFAHFIDGDAIERKKPQFVSEMLRSIGGVTLTASDRMGNVLRIRGCSPLVWVDGIRMPGVQLDEVAPAADVAAIEVYNSFAGIPSRYFDRTATCGTILVWLRS
jgi:hypothetical protein